MYKYYRDDFLLELWTTDEYDSRGCPQIGYQLFDAKYSNGAIFSGVDYYPSPLWCERINGQLVIQNWDYAAGSLAAYLSLQPGDVEQDYFDSYTEHQLAWAKERGESLYSAFEDLDGNNE
jgi:hypothetical protein